MIAEMTSGMKARVVARTLARPLMSVISLVEEFRMTEGVEVEELVEEMAEEGLVTLEKLPWGLVVRPSLRTLREEEARKEEEKVVEEEGEEVSLTRRHRANLRDLVELCEAAGLAREAVQLRAAL